MHPYPTVGIINGHDKLLKVIIYKMHTHTYGGERREKKKRNSHLFNVRLKVHDNGRQKNQL